MRNAIGRPLVFGMMLAGLPVAGYGACPVLDDLATGIEIVFDDGHRSMFTRDTDGVTTERVFGQDGASFNFLTDNGVLETGYYELSSPDGEPEAWKTYEYGFDVSEILPLKEWSGQSGYQIAFGPDGAEESRIIFGYRTQTSGPVMVGDCSYTGIPLETYYRNGNEGFRAVNFTFIHELEIPITLSYADYAGVEQWSPVQISLVAAE